MTVTATWTSPAAAGVLDLATGAPLTETVWDALISDLLWLGGATGVLSAGATPSITNAMLAADAKPGSIKIAELSGAAATYDFTSIPGTYKNLRLRYYVRSDTAATSTGLSIRFNGDSGANYDYQSLKGQTASASSAETFAATGLAPLTMVAGSAPANLFDAGSLFVPNYANAANNKSCILDHAFKAAATTGNMAVYHAAGFYRSNTALSRITLIPAAGSFAAGSYAVLYGET